MASKVLILGAGMAGISAAKYLHEHGIQDFLILEARKEIGGRLQSVKFGGVTVELGANWVHGLKGNPVYDLIQKYGIAGKITNYEDVTVRDQRGRDMTATYKKVYKRLEDAEEEADEFALEKIDKNQSDISHRAILRMYGWSPVTEMERLVDFFTFEFDTGEKPEIHSAKRYYSLDDGEHWDGDFFVADQRGFVHIVQAMSEEFLTPNDERLHLGEKVLEIKYSDSKVQVVTVKDGLKRKYTADAALATFSLGVLQDGIVNFDPPLPTRKLESLNEFRMTTYMKIFLKFPSGTKRFWDETEYILYLSDRSNYFSVWQNLETSGLLPAGTNVIMVTLTNEEAIRAEHLSDDQIKKEAMEVLREMYGKSVPDPEDFMTTRWRTDPLFAGSFTSWPVGYDSEQFDEMKRPLGALYFAGEAMDEDFTPDVNGAYASGLEQAKQIVQALVTVTSKI